MSWVRWKEVSEDTDELMRVLDTNIHQRKLCVMYLLDGEMLLGFAHFSLH